MGNAGIRCFPSMDEVRKFGTKKIIYQLRNTSIGNKDTFLYKNVEEALTNMKKTIQIKNKIRIVKGLLSCSGKMVFRVQKSNNDNITLPESAAVDSSILKLKNTLSPKPPLEDLVDFIYQNYDVNEKEMHEIVTKRFKMQDQQQYPNTPLKSIARDTIRPYLGKWEITRAYDLKAIDTSAGKFVQELIS